MTWRKLLEQFQGLYVDPVDAAKLAAGHLFSEIKEELGEAAARQVFAMWGTPPTPNKLKRIHNEGVRIRLELMPGGPNVKKLARQIAHEKYTNPTPQQIETEERQIQRLNARRIPRRKEAPAVLRNIPSLSYNRAKKLWRDNSTGKLYDTGGKEIGK
jgi:hypothetical protein